MKTADDPFVADKIQQAFRGLCGRKSAFLTFRQAGNVISIATLTTSGIPVSQPRKMNGAADRARLSRTSKLVLRVRKGQSHNLPGL